LPACEGGGNFTLFGYTTKPNYDCKIHTVYVPIFENRTFYHGLEFEVTRDVIREIEAKTPFKVVSDRDRADTELVGTIVVFTKNILNRDQYNQIREGETLLTANVVWRDLHTGEILSKPGKRVGDDPPPVLGLPIVSGPSPGPLGGSTISPPTMPPAPSVAAPNPVADSGATPPSAATTGPNGVAIGPNGVPVATPGPTSTLTASIPISSLGYFVPELGGSISTAMQQNANRLAIQIVSMMEKPW
jgi:hypothetical protein